MSHASSGLLDAVAVAVAVGVGVGVGAGGTGVNLEAAAPGELRGNVL